MEQEIKELLPTCSHVMNDIRYEGRNIVYNGTAEVHLISARSLKRICQLDKSDKDHVFVAEFREERSLPDLCGTLSTRERSAKQHIKGREWKWTGLGKRVKNCLFRWSL